MRIPYLKWAVFFLAVVLLEQFVFKFISQDVIPSLGKEKVMAALSIFTSGDKPTWESFDDEIRIPIERNGGLWAVKVEFNNFHEASLIIDSGANVTTLSSDFAFDLGLTENPYLPKIPLKTANGTTQAWVAQIESIRLGEVQQKNLPVVVVELPDLDVVGVLGLNFLGRFVWMLDQQNGYLILRPKSA